MTEQKRKRGRPSGNDSVALTGTIVKAALAHFKSRGYEQASLDAIASACRVSKHTIYRRFRGKADIFHAAMEMDRLRLSESIGGIDFDHLEAMPALKETARAIFDIASSKGSTDLYRTCIGAVPRFPAIGNEFAASIALICDIYEPLIAKAQRLGLLRAGDPRNLAEQIHYTTVGQIWGRAMLGEGYLEDDAYRSALFEANWSLFLHGTAA